jgi:hypothetical protein
MAVAVAKLDDWQTTDLRNCATYNEAGMTGAPRGDASSLFCISVQDRVKGSRSMELEGIHHLTAISAQIRENKRFYTEGCVWSSGASTRMM